MMIVTVSRLCQLPIFQTGVKLVAGSNGLDRRVEQVTIMETPFFADLDIMPPYLFVFSTLFTFKNEREYVFDMLEKLERKKVAALAVKTKRVVDDIPPLLMEAAEYYSLPLFSVTIETPFSVVNTAITSEVVNEHFNILKTLEEQHKFFLSSVLDGNDAINKFIRVLGKRLECYCCCLSTTGEMLSEHKLNEHDEQEKTIVNSCFLNEYMGKEIPTNPYSQISEYLIFPCYARSLIMGYLILKKEMLLSQYELLYVQQTVSYLSIILLEKRIEFETEQGLLISIADEIFFRRYSEDSMIRNRVQRLGLVPQKLYLIMLLNFQAKSMQRVWDMRERFWVDKIKKIFFNSAVFIKDEDIVAIISLEEKDVYANARMLRKVLQKLASGSQNVHIGYSLVIDDLTKLVDCYEQAKKAVVFGKAFKPEQKVYAYEDFIDKGLILYGINSWEHRMLVKKITETIQSYDSKYNNQLWHTLEQCISIGSLEKVAKEMHIHVSTLRYRLQRLHDLTGVDFFVPEGRFMYTVAYILSKL